MLHSPPPRPSSGALRLLRWLALYGSFGTAAGATAFVLEDQRRHICRLSKIRDNGKRLSEIMRRHNHTKTSPAPASHQARPGFHDYVEDLESKGLIKREPVAQRAKAGIGGHDEYHYTFEEGAHRPAKRASKQANPEYANDMPEAFTTRVRRIRSSKPPEEDTHLRYGINMSRQIQRKPPRIPARVPLHTRHLLAENFETAENMERKKRDIVGKAFQMLIASRNTHLDHKDLQEFLSAAAHCGDLIAIRALLDACDTELPWSEPLYPIFLQSLVIAASSKSMTSRNVERVFSLGRRVFEKSGIDPMTNVESFYKDGAFPLVMAAYKCSPSTAWNVDMSLLLLDCALRTTALGSLQTNVISNIILQNHQDPNFLTKLSRLLRTTPGATSSTSSYFLDVMQGYAIACHEAKWSTTPEALELLDQILERCSARLDGNIHEYYDIALVIARGDGFCEEWYSKFLVFCDSLGSDAEQLSAWKQRERLLSFGIERGFYDAIVMLTQSPRRHGVRDLASPSIVEAYLKVHEGSRTQVESAHVQRLITHLRKANKAYLIDSLFRKYFHLKLRLDICWRATITSSTQSEVLELLSLMQKPGSPLAGLNLEKAQVALLRQMWLCTRNLHQVEEFYDQMNDVRAGGLRTMDPGTVTLPDIMTEISAKAGEWEKVKRYAWDARHSAYHSQFMLSEAGFYYMTLVQARIGHWQNVQWRLREATTQVIARKYGDLYIKIFQIFCQQHSPPEAFAFFRWCISISGEPPSQHMFNILLSECLAEGDNQTVSEILGFMSEHRFHWQIQAETVAMSFRKYAKKNKPAGHSLMQCIDGVREYPLLLSKDACLVIMETLSLTARRNRVVGRERLNLMIERGKAKLVKQLAHLEDMALAAPWISDIKRSQSLLTRQPRNSENQLRYSESSHFDKTSRERAEAYHVKIQIAFSLHQWQDVISLYGAYVSQNVPHSQHSLTLAVTASLRLGDYPAASALIDNAAKAGVETAEAKTILTENLFTHSSKFPRDTEALRKAVFKHYGYLQSRHLPISHALLVRAAQILVLKKQPAASITLLSNVYTSGLTKIMPFDIVTMTAFLTAYSAARNVDGVRWTIKTILVKNLLLDLHFFRALNQCRRRLCGALLLDNQRKRSAEVFHLFKAWDLVCWRQYEVQQRKVHITGRIMANMLVKLYNKDVAPTRRGTVRGIIPKSYPGRRGFVKGYRRMIAAQRYSNSRGLSLHASELEATNDVPIWADVEQMWPGKTHEVEDRFTDQAPHTSTGSSQSQGTGDDVTGSDDHKPDERDEWTQEWAEVSETQLPKPDRGDENVEVAVQWLTAQAGKMKEELRLPLQETAPPKAQHLESVSGLPFMESELVHVSWLDGEDKPGEYAPFGLDGQLYHTKSSRQKGSRAAHIPGLEGQEEPVEDALYGLEGQISQNRLSHRQRIRANKPQS